MSLKTRLRISIVVPVITVVIVLSVLNLRQFVESKFGDALNRAQGTASQVVSFLLARIPEQAASQKPASRTPEQQKELWMQIVESDEAVAVLLQNSVANTRDVIEILIVGHDGRTLASSNPAALGEVVRQHPDAAAWQQKRFWEQLIEIFHAPGNYEVSVPLGVVGQQEPVFTVKAVISAVLLREALRPELIKLAAISFSGLGLSLLLAVIVSNVALASLARLGEAIDQITKGETDKEAEPPARAEAKEMAAVQSKLTLLGQQFRGARKDAVQLRSSIEQLLEKLEAGVLLFDQSGQLIVAGRAAERILGWRRSEMAGRRLEDLFPSSTPLGAVVRTSIELGKPIKDFSYIIEQAPAGPLTVLISLEVLEHFSTHQRIGTLVTIREAEPRRQIESHLEVATRLAGISRLTSGVAHEIKNPLNAIALHLEVLKSKLDEDGEGAAEIQVITREIRRLDRVVKTFLDFNRPVDLKMREVDLVSLLREISALVSLQAKEQDVKVEFEADSGTAPIRADRDLIKQAILNVVVNGVEAMRNGGRLLIRVTRSGDEQVLTISDQGIGIPPELKEKVFNLYFSTKKNGSGIGLAMTFRVVQLHSGTIEFTSEPGKGTTFWFRFPAFADGRTSVAESAAG
ncbi:MAG: PAS domain-containing protein [Bryobacterales bacterium]|nr:PAS domain-containing protein [Bryobacterales bacterium]